MSERIHYRPEVEQILQQAQKLIKLFDACKDDYQLQGIISVSLIQLLNRINLAEEELVLVHPEPSPPVLRPSRLRRERLTLPHSDVEPLVQPQPLEPKEQITYGSTGFFLCSQSEGRLLKSLEDTGVILVNEFLLVKMRGKISALALESRDGFRAGHWYAPRTSWMRETIRHAFDQGQKQITIPNDVWDYMRAANVDNLTNSSIHLNNTNLLGQVTSETDLLNVCAHILGKLPERMVPTIGDVSRLTYRMQQREGY